MSPRLRIYATATLASVAAVAVVTAVIALFERWVPVLSLGVLYIFAVLPIAVFWGLGFALAVSVASMLAFNWFFLAPRHTFTISDPKNWFALVVYTGTAVVVSELAARARRRAEAAERRERESALLARLATDLLRGRPPAEMEKQAALELGGGERSRRFRPALEALLAVAADRERLEGEALEAEALRRSDQIKTALLRAVSHDLR
jgi:two-component system sensor histidine kinase KdpD